MRRRWHMLSRSLMVRFILLAFILQFAATVAILVFVKEATERAFRNELRQMVSVQSEELHAAYREGGSRELEGLIDDLLASTRGRAAVALLIGKDGKRITGNLGAWPTVISPRTHWAELDVYMLGGERPEHIGVTAFSLPDGSRLLSGRVIYASTRIATINEEAIFAALLIGVSLALVTALVLGRTIALRIKSIVNTTGQVGSGALAQRVALDGSGDAFDALGSAINIMLDQIERLISQLRMITDGLAHDLKSPVTRLRSVIERAILDAQDDRSLDALQKVSQEADRLLAMLSTSLLVSRTEAGLGRDLFIDLEIAELFSDMAEIYGPLVEDHDFALVVDAPADLRMSVHRELLSQALGNLIENALKYAVGGTRIMLTAKSADGVITLIVGDDGPGIPADRHAEALARVGRLDPSRQKNGSGLGLTLVAAVVKLHGGSIALEDNQPGLSVVMRFHA